MTTSITSEYKDCRSDLPTCNFRRLLQCGRMRLRMRTWPFLVIGFGVLLALVALSTAALHRRMGQVYAEVAGIQQRERENRQILNQLRSEIYQTAILIRDYLLIRPQKQPPMSDRTWRSSGRHSETRRGGGASRPS